MTASTLTQIFAMLLQLHVCGIANFQRPDGTTLSVVTCPMEAPPAAPNEESH